MAKATIWVHGFRAFEGKEVREVWKEDAKILLRNPFIVEVKKKADLETSKKPKTTKGETEK